MRMFRKDGRKGQWILVGGFAFLVIISSAIAARYFLVSPEIPVFEKSFIDSATKLSSKVLQNVSAEANAAMRENTAMEAYDLFYTLAKEKMMDFGAVYLIIYCNETNAEVQVINLMNDAIRNVNVSMGSLNVFFTQIGSMRSEVSVTSRPSAGSTFLFTFDDADLTDYCFQGKLRSCSMYQGVVKLESTRGVWSMPVGIMDEC